MPMNINIFRNALLREMVVSCLMSLIWVSSYGYRYNLSFFNSPFINWLAFLLWSTGLFITLRTYQFSKFIICPLWLRLPLIWMVYFSVLLVIEYFGYYIFGIREMTTEKPLCFGLIHGTLTLKIYYLLAGIAAIFLNHTVKILGQAFSSQE